MLSMVLWHVVILAIGGFGMFMMNKYCNFQTPEWITYSIFWPSLAVVAYSAFTLLIGTVCYMDSVGDVRRYEATAQTIETARSNKDISEYELAALQTEIVKVNRSVANIIYWSNLPWCKQFYCDKARTLEPLK